MYLASHISLGILEVIVQAGTASLAGYAAYPIEIPDGDVSRFDRSRLNKRWRTMAGRDECRGFAEEWRASKTSLGLLVPSAVLPEAYDNGDYNVILDPEHPGFAHVMLGDAIPLTIDPRLATLIAK
ncbi:MAG: RES family NAD+ phosphorylase [Candidatus Velthaea sp.]